jgi:hypothetical protein
VAQKLVLLHVEGQFVELLTDWIPSCKDISSSYYTLVISFKLKFKNLAKPLAIINIYKPYVDRIPFWDNLANSGAFNDPLTLVGGDFNFTLNLREVWRPNLRRDTQCRLISSFLAKHRLIDLEPLKLTPTWRNFKVREGVVSKRLDHFLVSEQLFNCSFTLKTWVSTGGISDLFAYSFSNDIMERLPAHALQV